MTRNLKTLGLALVAAFAICAAAASAASAEAAFFYAEEETPVTLKGTQHSSEDVLTTTAGTVQCSEVTYTGELSEQEANAVDVAPAYTGCTAFGFAGTTFQMNGCTYRLSPGTFGSEKPEGSVDIVCPEGKEITVTALLFGTTKCTIHVPPQSNLGTVTYTNVEGSANEVTVALNIGETIEYTHTAGTGFGACSSGSAGNGKYTGAALLTGNAGEALIGLAVLVPKPLFVLNPEQVNFGGGGKGTKKPTVIENKSQEEPRLNFILPTGKFESIDKCFKVTLKKEKIAGDKCTEEVECQEAKAKDAFLFVAATAHYAINTAELKNC